MAETITERYVLARESVYNGRMMTKARIPVPERRLADFCKRNKTRFLGLFGSVLRADFRADSNVDVLVDFEPRRVSD